MKFFVSISFSCSNELFLIINLSIKRIEIFNQHVTSKWNSRLRIVWSLTRYLRIKFIPFLIQSFSIFFILLNSINFLLCWIHLQSFIESKRINLFQDGLQSNQRFLKYLMPMILSQVNNDWYKHWECFLFVCL